MKRRGTAGWRLRALGAVALVVILAYGVWIWHLSGWRPDEARFPDQGVAVSAKDGPVEFATLKALGADFAYLAATSGADGHDPAFSRNMAAARAAGLQVGAIHIFDPCTPAERQSANFVTQVPRGQNMLPPAIALSRVEECHHHAPDAEVESELMTFINQIENHIGKPVILKVTPEFEDRYHLSDQFERNLWLVRNRFEPDYAGRPWMVWSANTALNTQAAPGPLEWVVVRP